MKKPAEDKKKTARKKTTKKTTTRKRTPKKAEAKGWGDGNIWTPISGSTFGPGFDPSARGTNPTPVELAAAYEDIVYSCVNLIAHAVAKEAAKFKLVATSGPNDPRPKSPTKFFNPAEVKRLEAAYPIPTRRAIHMDEVIGHGLLDLLDSPNQLQSFEKLLALTETYLELIGSAFWYISGPVIGGRRVPTALWLLPSHLITLDTDPGTGDLIGYKFGSGDQEAYYLPDEVIHFRYTPDPLDPYTSFGTSPVKAVWQRVQLLRREQTSWESVLANMAVPSALVSPPEGEMYTPAQAERITKQLNERFRWSNQGGVWVVSEGMKYTPMSTPPRDLAALTMYDGIKASVARAYGIPLAILDLSEGTSEASDVAQRTFQRYCLAPRIDSILETISSHLCTPRTFLATANVVSPDKVFELQRITALVAGNIATVNEGRVAAGLEAKPGYDKLVNELMDVGTASAQTFQTSFTGGRTKTAHTKAYRSTTPDPKPLANALGQVFAKLASDVTGKLVGKGITARVKSFIPMADWTKEMAEVLTPVMRAYVDEGLNAVLAEIGGAPDIGSNAVQELDSAVNGAVLALAKSTLSTTDMSVTEAVEATREAIRAGLDAGEANSKLADRLKDIFTDVSDRRVMLIAETESTRAKHTGELLAIQAAGVEIRKRWLPDSMACDQCRGLAAKGAIGLDATFETKGSGPYARIDHPPAHPGCRCTLQYEFEE